MPDHRRHRGSHPRDRELFDAAWRPLLAAAAADYAWLLTRGYAPRATLALVGDRHGLVERQRAAVARVACSDHARARRRATHAAREELAGNVLAVDGFNVIISVEVALAGGLGLIGLDGARRDLASVHGTYRRVLETPRAIELLAAALAACRAAEVRWYLDRPVSNSGNLAKVIRTGCAPYASTCRFGIELVDDVDRQLCAPGLVALSADSGVLDAAERWFDLAGWVVRESVPEAWTLDLSGAVPS